MKVINFGSLNIDHVYNVARFPLPGETVSSTRYAKYCGGKGLNQSVAVANSGVQVFHAGQVGPDGDVLLDFLRERGIDVTHVARSEKPTGHALIQVDENGQNSIILFEGANKSIPAAFIDRVLEEVSAGDALLLQNEINGLPHLLKRAKEKGLTVFFNPAPFTEDVRGYPLDAVRYLIVNETEAMGLTGTDQTEAAIARLRRDAVCPHTVVTLGTEGCCHIAGGAARYYGTYQVEAVDTTAAGDTFIGFLVGELTRGGGMEKAILLAAKAAALTVTKAGASASIPTMDQVLTAELEYKRPNMEREQVV